MRKSQSMTEGQQRATGQVRIKNILTPVLWLVGSLSATLIGVVGFGAPQYVIVTVIVIWGLSIFSALANYQYFAIKDRDRLHSEEYLIKKDTLNYKIQGRGIDPDRIDQTLGGNPVVLDAESKQ